ncbi:HisA/HisF-related TIM barrel protein [Rhodoferax saidenbachensis]|uniref:imidazole glycerol phosphate synthase subunit HisF n=1 Tax=Rhodoferax saidenbachensis TaxID=1484693 RepID=UPI00286BE5A3|nr:HisA/HisF-related TIM barrel protein [Rhodoferax saidenbachensis]
MLLYRNGSIVRSQQFERHFKIGDEMQQMQRYMDWDADEVVYLDISQPNTTTPNLLSQLPKISQNCFAPLSVGGNIHTLEDIEDYLHAGADRVILGSVAVDRPNFIDQAAHRFGSQAIIVSVDYRALSQTGYSVFTKNGSILSEKNIISWVDELHQRGVGEILLHSIDRDGMGGGYDLELISVLNQETSVPIIACGGASSYHHFIEAINHGASAVAASNIFGFKELAYANTKAALAGAELPIRF